MWKIKVDEPDHHNTGSENAIDALSAEEEERILFGRKDERTEKMLVLKLAIHRSLLDRLNLAMLDQAPVEQIKSQISAMLPELLADFDEPLNREEREKLVQELVDELLGLGPLEPLLADDTITDILVNGPDTVFVEKRGMLERSG